MAADEKPPVLIPEQRHWLEDLHGMCLHEAALHTAAAFAEECADRAGELYDAQVCRARAGYIERHLLGWVS